MIEREAEAKDGADLFERVLERDNLNKAKVRELTRRNQGNSVEWMLYKLRQYTVGWLGYYAIADMKKFMQNTNEWIRRKIRTYVWKQWKRVRTRFARLQLLGIPKGKAY